MKELTQPTEADTEPTPAAEPFPAVIERAVNRAGRPLGWMWDRGFRFLFVLDAVALFGAMVAINFARFGWTWPTYPRSHYWIGFSIATGIHLLIFYFAGLYEREVRLGHRPWLPRVAVASGIAVAFDGLAALLTDRYLMPRLNLAVFFLVGALAVTGNRSVSRYFARRRRGPSRVLLVGHGETVETARRHFEATADAEVVGTVERPNELFEIVNASQATDVLLLDLAAFSSAFPEPLTALDREGVGVHQRVSARETLLGLQSVREIAGMPFTRMRTHAMASHQLRLKRLFDLFVIVVTAPITVPSVALLALYVRMRAGSGVLYRQTRVGLYGKRFTVVKFRTMVPDAESLGPQLSSERDDRVVRGLAWMRSTRADELPQFWNVLKGEMSLVGPRPERPEMISKIERDVAGYARRHELPPGVTGLAQIHGRYDTDADYKLGYDLQYLVNWSLVLDIQILLRTVWVVLSRRV
ncbi:MAG: exopolysaccharide biosynthesis polyprenyl glycosylphosphotransferase [Ilumatobacter sp.]|uniref:exopolysaccharide biosynthesis polyprenyl glycosylphosphotransferase n=1 Tax=Ilumatobacter sp. TaxID=1967498 RepID=UPI002619904B|nr:exopolysaccharide biosynthesis polyprenyl glycosylphosphotransferase [Ilumatobacter sp.]MDJ0768345.1 exopolysaccharide biosynthesis polyprenyl glycosylphosphotransferase [Ilumatobacter sp.]